MVATDYIEKAWNAYKNNFWLIFAALLFQIIVALIPILIGIAPWLVIFFFSGATLTTANITNLVLSNLGLLLFSIIMLIISIILSIALAGGFVRMLYEALKGKTKFETMIKTAKQKFWTLIGAHLIVIVLALLIFAILMLPSIVLYLSYANSILPVVFVANFLLSIIILVVVIIFLAFVDQAIVIDNMTAVESVKKSFEFSKKNFSNLIFIFLIFFVINIIVQMIPIVGGLIAVFLTSPLLLLSYTALYIGKRKKR